MKPPRTFTAIAWLLLPLTGCAAVLYMDQGTLGPPSALGGYAITSLLPDPRSVGSVVTETGAIPSVSLDRPATLLGIGEGWSTWSHGYGGQTYYTSTAELVLTPPPNTLAFGLSIQPNLDGLFAFDVTANGVTARLSINGDGGARYIGFWSDNSHDPLTYLRIWDVTGAAEGFAVAELTLFWVPEPASCATVLGGLSLAWLFLTRRVGR